MEHGHFQSCLDRNYWLLLQKVSVLNLQYVHPDDRQRKQELFETLINRQQESCRHEVRYPLKMGAIVGWKLMPG